MGDIACHAMKLEPRRISDLREWDKNPRSVSPEAFERLKYQITKFKDYKPLLITPDGTVIGGNMRLKAYKELGIKETMVSVVTPKNENEKWEYALSDNDHVGKTDADILANEMPNLDIDWSKYAVDIKEPVNLQELLDQFKPIEEDEAPEVEQGKAVSKLGEVYQLGRHRLMCGDSTKIEDVEKLMDGKKADMVFTDPPYALFGNSTGVEGIVDDNMVRPFFRDIFNQCKRFTKKFGHVYVCCDWHSAFALESVARDVELPAKNMCIWYKGQGGVGGMYSHCYEIVWFFANSPVSKTTMGHGESGERTVNGISNVWEVKREKEGLHNAQKPVEMIQIPVKAGCDTDDMVLDLFGGSGSTLIACEQTNRICYMCELDEKYVDVIRKRYWRFTHNNNEEGWQDGTKAV